MDTDPDTSTPAVCEPSGLMWACLTVSGTAAAETAVCSKHLTGYVPRPWGDDGDPVQDLTLHDVTGNDALSCAMCGATADDLAYTRDRGHNVRPTTTVTFTVPAVLTVTVEVDGEASRYYSGAHRADIVDVGVVMPDGDGTVVEAVGPDPALRAVDPVEVMRLARVEVESGIYPAPHWS